jgi:succinyl-diaminopimelate desuccinylase
VTAWWRARDGVAEVVEDLRLDPVWTRADHAFVRSLPAPLASGPASYYTDASVLQRTLPSGTPVVVWGPGDPRRVHAVDESVALEDVVDAVDLYERAARAWWAGVGGS